MLTGLAGAGALAALPARAQLPGWIMDKAPAAPPVDSLSVARAQLARESHHVAQTDRVGIVDFGLPSWRPRFALGDLVAGTIDLYPVTHGRGSARQHDGWLKTFLHAPGRLPRSCLAITTNPHSVV